MAFFEITVRSGEARLGRLHTAHGDVETPVFMPVGTLATVKGVPQDVLEELGVEILLSNTYHLLLRPGTRNVRDLGGLHRFMAWERAILTDSGGYQVFSLSDLRKVNEEGVEFRSHLDGALHFLTPESAMAAQIDLGADIIMAFDECTEHPADRERTRRSLELTLRWAKRCRAYFEEHKSEVPWNASVWNTTLHSQPALAESAPPEAQTLFGIVQGGMHPDLRRESAQRTVELDFPGYAVGGLSVGEPRAMTREMVEVVLRELPSDRPRYLMGVGTPEEIVEYAAMGVDMMDCVLPTRAGRHGLLFTSEGKLSIKNARFARDESALDPRCGCRVCARYSRAYLRHLYSANESLAGLLNTVHNLSHYLDTMRQLRHSIKLGRLEAFVSERRSQRLNSPVPFAGEDPA
jgi:queuine tRNA-ribosyltransferase